MQHHPAPRRRACHLREPSAQAAARVRGHTRRVGLARIAGVDIPNDKPVHISLTYIYGIGRTKSREAVSAIGVDAQTRVKDLTEDEIARVRDYIDRHFVVEGDLRREVDLNIKRLIDISFYRGLRLR